MLYQRGFIQKTAWSRCRDPEQNIEENIGNAAEVGDRVLGHHKNTPTESPNQGLEGFTDTETTIREPVWI